MGVEAIDVDELDGILAEGAFLLDVRQPDEYEEAHVPGAVLIPLGDLGARVDEVPRGSAVYVICHSGGRSHKAAEALLSVGVAATNVVGGTQAWIDAEKPTASGPLPG